MQTQTQTQMQSEEEGICVSCEEAPRLHVRTELHAGYMWIGHTGQLWMIVMFRRTRQSCVALAGACTKAIRAIPLGQPGTNDSGASTWGTRVSDGKTDVGQLIRGRAASGLRATAAMAASKYTSGCSLVPTTWPCLGVCSLWMVGLLLCASCLCPLVSNQASHHGTWRR
jgi:hypothetical protein